MTLEHQSKNKKILLIVLALIVLAGIFCVTKFTILESSEPAVRTLVENFGQTLKNISLLSPTVAQELESNYKDFVSPELLNEWTADPTKAPGRLTSSPWPERIEIIGLNKTSADTYFVQGEIVEMTSSGAAEKQPVVLIVQKSESSGKRWLIISVLTGSRQNEVSSANFGNEQLEKAITGYLLTQSSFSWKTRDDSHNFCVIENLKPENELFPLYVWANCGEYVIENGQLITLSGASGPVKINYPNELSFYDVSRFSHEVPGDGSRYTSDIKRIFPEDVWPRVFDFDRKSITSRLENLAIVNISSWEAIKQAVNSCEAKSAFQNHSREVTVELKSGNKLTAIEPKIDDIMKIVSAAEDKCGRIPIATE